MKILNINPYINTKPINKINHTKPISFTSLEQPKKTSINPFKKLSLQLEAKGLEKKAKTIVEDSKEITTYAIERQEFFEDKIKQANDIQENARFMYFDTIGDFANDLPDYDEKMEGQLQEKVIKNPKNGVLKRTIERIDDNYKVIDYREDGTVKKTTRVNGETTISEIGAKGVTKVYYFDENGYLTTYARKPKLKNDVYTADERYIFKDGKPLGWEEFSTIVYSEGVEKAFQRAEFKNDKLSGLSIDWTKSNVDMIRNIIRAKEFYTFEDGIFYSYLKNYQAEPMSGDGFNASSMLRMTPDKKVSYFAQDIDLSGDAFGYFGKYFEYGRNNNPKYIQVGVDILDGGMQAGKIFEVSNDKITKCHFDAKIDGLGQIISKDKVEF